MPIRPWLATAALGFVVSNIMWTASAELRFLATVAGVAIGAILPCAVSWTIRCFLWMRCAVCQPRKIQFRLSSLLIAVALTAPVFAVLGKHATVYQEQVRFSEAVTQVGGTATIRVINYRTEWRRRWRAFTADTDLMAEFRSCPTTDKDLYKLSQHPCRGALRLLFLDDSRITDSGLKYLKEFPNLRTVSLCGCQISDAGLLQLQDVRSLKDVCCRNTPTITAAGTKELKKRRPALSIYRTQSLDPE